MATLTGNAILLDDGAGRVVRMEFDGDDFVIKADSGVTGIVIDHGGDRVRVEANSVTTTAPLVRLDGETRVEIHADIVTRIDAGGSGYTFTPLEWTAYYPKYATGYLIAPPEHPDTGGTRYSVDGADAKNHYFAIWQTMFPGATP
jgi:hypothetical protein